MEEATWVLRYIVINVHDGLPSRKVLVAPTWVAWIDWISMQMRVELTTDAVEESLEYDPAVLVDREYEV